MSLDKTFVQFLLEGFPVILTHKIRFLREVPLVIVHLESRTPRLVHQNPTPLELLLFDQIPPGDSSEDGELVPRIFPELLLLPFLISQKLCSWIIDFPAKAFNQMEDPLGASLKRIKRCLGLSLAYFLPHNLAQGSDE